MSARPRPKVDLDATVERLHRVGLSHAAERLGERLEQASKDSGDAGAECRAGSDLCRGD